MTHTARLTVPSHALTFDVEDWYQGYVYRGLTGWERYASRELANVEKILSLLREFDTKATFFVLGKYAEENRHVVDLIDQQGHEIASHGYVHIPVPKQTQKEFREDIRRSLSVLEGITGKKIFGHRAARWSIGSQCLWALDVLAEEGLVYDSSIFPTRLHNGGISEFPTHAHRIELPSGASIMEFPAQVLTLGSVRVPAAGGFYFRALPSVVARWALAQAQRRGQSGMVYLHPYDFDTDAPRLKAPLLFKIIRHYNLERTEHRLRCLLERFEFSSIQAILRFLSHRSQTNQGPEVDAE